MRRALPLLLLAAACSSPPIAPAMPSTWQVTGDNQTGVPGYRLANQITVRVLDADGRAIIGDTVDFTTSDQYAKVEPSAVAVTDSGGRISVNWRLGAVIGTQTLQARSRVPGVAGATVTATSRSNAMLSIGGGEFGMCGIDSQGRLGCWLPPHLDTPDAAPNFSPASATARFAQVAMLPAITSGRVGSGCALTDAGQTWCFSLDSDAHVVGLAQLAGSYPAFAQIVSSEVDNSSSPGAYCALTATGSAWCWGDNTSSRLGDGTTTTRTAPTQVAASVQFSQLDMAVRTSCGVSMAGEAWCWGENGGRQAGGATSANVTTPQRVSAPVLFSHVRVLWFIGASCGFGRGGEMYCWGDLRDLPGEQGTSVTPIPTAVFTTGAPIDLAEVWDIQLTQPRTFAIDQRATIHELTFGSPSVTNVAALPSAMVLAPGALLRDFQSPHGGGYLCGTAALGNGTLCNAPHRATSDISPFSYYRPAVVGVPFP